jgi:hypothetical protein
MKGAVHATVTLRQQGRAPLPRPARRPLGAIHRPETAADRPAGRPAGRDQADLGTAQRLQALVSAFHYGAPVGFGWIREQAGGPVRVLAVGPALAGAAEGGQVVLSIPAAARARPLPPGQALDLLARMPCWMPLAGVTDALLSGSSEKERHDRDTRPSLEDGLMSVWSGPFAWLVLAEPVPAGRLGELTEEVSQAQQGAQRFDSPSAQLAVQRLSARHAELRQAAATGLWQVRLLAGGPVPHAAVQVAGLLCASADLDGLPYALVPTGGGAGLDEILDHVLTVGHALPAVAGMPGPRARRRSLWGPCWTGTGYPRESWPFRGRR